MALVSQFTRERRWFGFRRYVALGLILFAGLLPLASVAQPVITQQPQSQTVSSGTDVTLSVGATGTAPLIYQWRLNGVNIPGANGSTLFLPRLQAGDAGDYSVAVGDAFGAINSDVARIRIQNLTNLPFTDAMQGQNAVGGSSGTGRGSNAGATKEPGEPNHAGKPGTNSVWLTWQPPLGGVLGGVATFSTEGSSFDTVIAVYKGNNVTNLTLVVANDDRTECGDETRGYHTSSVRFKVELGAVYHIAVDGVAGAKGDIVLNWNVDLLENLLGILSITPTLKVGLPGDTVTLTVDLLGSARYQWFRNCEPIPGATENVLVIDNLQASKVGLYFARVESTLTGAAATSDLVDVQINITDGRLADVSAQNKFGELAELVKASTVTQSRLQKASLGPIRVRKLTGGTASGYTGTQIFSTFGSTKESGEPNHCGVIGGASEWYSYVPPVNGVMFLNTDGSDFNTVLAVYTVPPGQPVTFENLQSVTCDNQTGNGGDSVVFPASTDTIYYIVVDGVSGSRGTVHLNYNLNVPPTINQQPLSQTVPPGATANFTVTASGVPSPVYQWQFNGTNLDWATNNSLTLTNVQSSHAGMYRTLVSNAAATVTSAGAVLTVVEPPSITTQPQSQTVVVGANVALSVAVGGTAPFNFQWRFESANLAGATNQTLSLTNVLPAAAGDYSVAISNAAGTTISSNAVLSVIAPPAITVQPQSLTVVAGTNVTLNVEVAGTPPFLFQWRVGGENIPGATNQMLSLANVQPSHAGAYSVVVSNAAGEVTSSAAVLAVLVPPSILTQPQSRIVYVGTDVTFNVAADGTEPLSYQWRRGGTPIPDAVTATLLLTNVQSDQAGNYSVEVSNGAGVVVSSPATLSLASPLILDLLGVSTNGECSMRLNGIAGWNYVIEASTDLAAWAALATNSPPDGIWQFVDTASTNFTRRFYRALAVE